MEFTVALINAGNRQGLVSNVSIQTPVLVTGKPAFLSVPGAEVTSGEIPAVLTPGEVKLIRFQGHVPAIDDSVRTFESQNLPQEKDAGRNSDKGTQVYAVIRAIDFRGAKYEAKWKLCSIQYASAGSVGWSPGEEQIAVFAPQHRAEDKNWLSTDSMKRLAERNKREQAQPPSQE